MAKATRNEALIAAGIEPDTAMEILTGDQLIDVYIELSKIQKEADKIKKSAESESAAIMGDVIDHFTQLGQEKVTRRGRTVYLTCDKWPKVLFNDLVEDELLANGGVELTKDQMDYLRDLGKDRLIKALAGSPDTEHLVKEAYNTNSLRGFMSRDCDVDDETGFAIVPEHLEGKLGTSEVFKAKVLSK